MSKLFFKIATGSIFALLVAVNSVSANQANEDDVRYYVQSQVGYSSFNLENSYQTNPILTQNTKADDTSSHEFSLGMENLLDSALNPFVTVSRTDWQNGEYFMVGAGVDYTFEPVIGFAPYAGGFIGEGMFENDLLNDKESGTVYRLSGGVKYPLSKRFALNLQMSHTAIDLKTTLQTNQISRDITLKSMTSVYAGVQFLLF